VRLRRRPGQHDHDGAARVEHGAGGGAREAERDRARRKNGLLGHALLEVRVGTPEPVGDALRDRLDLSAQVFAQLELDSCGACDQLDGAIVVRGAEAAGGHAEVGVEARAERRLELLLPVPDDQEARRLEPERERLAREERAVEVRPLAADELRPGDDEDRAGPRQAEGRTCPVAVIRRRLGPVVLGSRSVWWFTITRRFSAEPALIQTVRAGKSRAGRPGSSVPWKSSRPVGEPRCTSSRDAPRTALITSRLAGVRCARFVVAVWRFGIFCGPPEPPNFHAANTSAVTTAIAPSVTSTTLDSKRRWSRARRRPTSSR